MLKTTLLAAAALSFVALGATTADAKGGHGHGGYSKHGGHGDHHGRHGGGHGYHKFHKYNKFNNFWLSYSRYRARCHYEPERVRIKVWDRRGNAYFKWVKRDVKVCY